MIDPAPSARRRPLALGLCVFFVGAAALSCTGKPAPPPRIAEAPVAPQAPAEEAPAEEAPLETLRTYARPASNLGELWRTPGQSPRSMHGRLYLASPSGGLVETDPMTGAAQRAQPIQSLALPPGIQIMQELSTDDQLIAVEGPWLVALDPADGKVRWQVRCSAKDAPCDVKGRKVGSTALVAGRIEFTSPSYPIGLVALDWKTGRQLWRRVTSLTDTFSLKIASDERRVYLMNWGQVLAFDATNGRTAWERSVAREMTPSSGTQLVAGGGVVAFWETLRAVHIVEAKSGKDISVIPWDDLVQDMLFRSGVLYVTASRTREGSTIAAIRPSNGRILWRRDIDQRWIAPPVLVDEDVLFVRLENDETRASSGEGSEVTALDRASGATVWSYPVGRTDAMLLFPVPGQAPLLVAELPGREVVAFARREQPPASSDITISGAVRAFGFAPGSLDGLRVEVGDVVVKTEKGGRYSAQVKGLGVLRVKLLDGPRSRSGRAAPFLSDPEFLRPSRGTATYQVDLKLRRVTP